MMRVITFFLFALCSINSSLAQQHQKLKVLFLGNSYTYVNNLPQLIKDIALANGDTLIFDSNCPGGYSFSNHFSNTTSVAKINSQAWDCIILQAQSQEPSFDPSQVEAETLPYAIKLDSTIKYNNACSQTVFYETWGRKNGDASNCAAYPPICTYTGMQNRLKESYKLFADTTHGVMSPAGEAFRKSIALNPGLELYSSDQSHPSLEGSYLTACVFYEVLFHKSVLTNSYTAGVSASTVSFLQQVAHDVVNDSLLVWNIGKYDPCSITNIYSVSQESGILLYPNPVKTKLNFSISNSLRNNISSIKITNELGKIILKEQLINNSVDVSFLSEGLYFAEIRTKDNSYEVLKFIKE